MRALNRFTSVFTVLIDFSLRSANTTRNARAGNGLSCTNQFVIASLRLAGLFLLVLRYGKPGQGNGNDSNRQCGSQGFLSQHRLSLFCVPNE